MQWDFELGRNQAEKLDELDPLKEFRNEFAIPKLDGKDALYFCGNSLGLMPKQTREFINDELDDWAKFGVEGHLEARHPWLPYHEEVCQDTAMVVGANPSEVVCMNTLTVNLHLMMVSFYRPTKDRYKIIIEGGAFPSDQYAVASQAKFHGFAPEDAIVELTPRSGESILRKEDILQKIEEVGSETALVLLGGVNYLTGQLYPMEEITNTAHKMGCIVGFDLAHGAGNAPLKLHDWGVDFAAWCSYKYMNSGPGGIAGCYVHERHSTTDRPRFAGWWGHDKKVRFKMEPQFVPMAGAEGWQLSNPPIFQLAALRSSLELFRKAGMERLREKSIQLTGYLEFLIDKELGGSDLMVTLRSPEERGAQISFRFPAAADMLSSLKSKGVICDFREPDIIRAAPVPLYNRYQDVYDLIQVLKACQT